MIFTIIKQSGLFVFAKTHNFKAGQEGCTVFGV